MGHAALADMLSLYIRKEVCETKRLQLAPIPKRSEANLAVWPLEEDMGKMPELALWSKVSRFRFQFSSLVSRELMCRNHPFTVEGT